MTEEIKKTNTDTEDNKNEESGHGKHHSHHHRHHHSHHHHHSHSHSHHKSEGKGVASGSSDSIKNFSILKFIHKKSTSRTHKQVPKHRVVSRRILFCILLLSFIFITIAGIFTGESGQENSGAGSTRSESDQLKNQITMLQLEKRELEEELAKYKALYGELDENK